MQYMIVLYFNTYIAIVFEIRGQYKSAFVNVILGLYYLF